MNPEYYTAAGFFLTVFGGLWSLAWWLSGKFTVMEDNINKKLEMVKTTLLDKLEYHERHDDSRFSGIRNDIWELRIHNAARDGMVKKVKIKASEEAPH